MVLRKSSPSNINTHAGSGGNDEFEFSSVKNGDRNDLFSNVAGKEKKIIRCLEQRDVDLWKLREFALSKGGLVNENVRRKAWHKLVNVNAYAIDNDVRQIGVDTDSPEKTEEEKAEIDLIKRDVERSVVFKHKKKSSSAAEQKDLDNHEELQKIHIQTILSALSSSSSRNKQSSQKESDTDNNEKEGEEANIQTKKERRHKKLHYYQGYQDITAIILQIYADSPPLASSILSTISKSHLRDAMRENFTTLNAVYSAITYPLLLAIDVELHDYLVNYADVELHNAILKWVITWFAHDVHDINIVERLFDVFLASHPLMPLYLSMAIITHPNNRLDILHGECDAAMIHIAIQEMASKITLEENGSGIGLENLIESAIEMMKKVLPLSLLARAKRYRLNDSTTASPSTNPLKLAASAKLLRVPASWAIASTAPSDWVQYQQQQASSKKNGNRKKTSSPRNGSSTLAAAATGGGTKKELLTPDILTDVNEKQNQLAKIASGVSVLMTDEDLADGSTKARSAPQRRRSSFLGRSLSAKKYFHNSSSVVLGMFESILHTLRLSMSMKRVEENSRLISSH